MEPSEIVVHNRPLVRVNGRIISVLDVKKKMDFYLFERYPEAFKSNLARYQFYTEFWQQQLDEMIVAELILMEAEELKFTQSDGDVSQELDRRLGAHPLAALEQLQMKQDEVHQIVKRDLTYQQFFWFYVYNKAQQKAKPDAIAKAYESYIETHKTPERWVYDVITVRGEDVDQMQNAAQSLYTSLVEAPKEPEAVTCVLTQAKEDTTEGIAISQSTSIEQDDDLLALETRKVLASLAFDESSPPLYQMSRSDNTPLFRIYTLRDHTLEEAPPLAEVASELKTQLLNQEVQQQSEAYFKRLKERYGYGDLNLTELTKESGFSISL